MKKMKACSKKTISVCLSLLVVFSAILAVSSVNVSATEKTGTISYDESFYEQYSDACEAVAQGIRNYETNIDISEYNVPYDKTTIGNIYRCVSYRNPDIFYAPGIYSYYIYDNKITSVVLDYELSVDEIKQKQSEMNEVVDRYMSKINSSMTDFQKAVVLHDEIVLNSYYTSGTSVYDFFVEGKGQCVAYVKAYTYLLSLAGIDSEFVTSTEMNHAWCKVKIDGEYYNVDITYDDPVNDSLGHVSHKYFLYSDSAFKSGADGIEVHSDYDDSYYDAVSTKYDSFSTLHEINSRFCYSDGICYAVDNEYGSDYSKCLITYDETDDTASVINKFNIKWSTGSGGYWSNGFISLDQYEGILYCNTDNTIYYYDIADETLEKYDTDVDLENKCYGLIIKDGQIYASITDNPNYTGEWVLVGNCIQNSVLLGDVNGDGKVSISDASLLQKYLAEMVDLDSKALEAADVNGDGKVSISDAGLIQKYLAEMIVF